MRTTDMTADLNLPRVLMATVFSLCAVHPVLGQPSPMVSTVPAAVFAIKGFKIIGDNPLGDGETSRVLAPFLRADASIETLQKATTALEAALRDKGFGLHRVALPPQEVGDTVTLNIIKFSIGKVAVEGNNAYSQANIRRSVPELTEGGTPNFKQMAIETAIANENAGKQIQVALKEASEPDKIDATVTVKETKPWNVAISLSNGGSSSSGRDRITLSGSHSNLFDRDHQFVGAYTTSLERIQDVKQLGLSYRIPVYAWGGVVGATYTRSDVVGNFGTFTSTGAGHTLGMNYTVYLQPEGGRRSYLTFGLDDKVFNPTRINDIAVPGQLLRRSRPLTLGYSSRTESDVAVWGYGAELAFNTGSGTGNNLTAYRNEDPRINTTRWKVLRANANYSAPFAGNWVWGVRGQAQLSPDVLISGEQFGLGGQGSVRGAGERPISGDKGISTAFEITTPLLAPGLRFVGFLEAGWLANNSANGTSKPSSDSLSGFGLGLRYGNGPFSVTADYGRVISGSGVPLSINSAAPRRGDDKLYLNLAVRF
jgi:hemolysin activation/secretion protein